MEEFEPIGTKLESGRYKIGCLGYIETIKRSHGSNVDACQEMLGKWK